MAVLCCSGGWTNKIQAQEGGSEGHYESKENEIPQTAAPSTADCSPAVPHAGPCGIQLYGTAAGGSENDYQDEDTEIPTGEVYTVVLTAEDDAPLPEETRLTVTDNGTVEFGPITYTKPGDYVYTVYQDVGETEFYTYDRAIYTVTVRVVNDDEGGLTAEIWAIRDDETEKMENVVFTNVYTPEEEPEPDGSSSASTSAKPLVKKPNTPKTGDSANLTLWTCLLAASALGIITLLAALLKRNQK